jgi:hypothetical protein
MLSYEEIKRIKESVEDEWLKIPGVNGIAVAKKRVNNERTPEFSIVVYVSVKRPLSEIPVAEQIPPEINGVKTDIVQQGPMTIRSYKGGIEIESEYMRNQPGSLGCFGFTTESTPRPVLLTNQHVLLPFQVTSLKGGEVGPNICTCCSSCCSTVIAIMHDAVLDPFVDGAIALLKQGTSILFEVTGIGLIKPSRKLDVVDFTNNIPLKMYSVQQGKVVTGTLETDTYTGPIYDEVDGENKVQRIAKDHIQIKADPVNPIFGDYGDSGSVVFDAQNHIVGLYCGGTDAEGMACPIKDVESKLHITIGTASQLNQPFVVPAAPGIPSSAAPILNYPLTGGQGIEIYTAKMKELYQEILKLPAGKYYHDLFVRHRMEVRGLVNTNKKVAATWHRNKGPLFMQSFYRNLLEDDFQFTKEIDGVSIKGLFQNMATILLKYGNPGLKTDITDHLQDIFGYIDECNTKKELMTKLADSLPASSAA